MQPQGSNFFQAEIPEKRAKITTQDGLDITWITDREIIEDRLFEELFTSPEFIEEIRETDDLYREEPNQFTNLSKIYRENKKLK